MTRLVICCDGTWNTPDQEKNDVPTPSNVVRIYNTLLDDADQRRYYHPGVGTDGSKLDRLRGGGMGTGLAKNIKSAYAWLARNHRPGDSIYLFGFSRGAYTVRSLAGMLRACGLLELTAPPAKADWAEIDRLYDECYRPDGQAGHKPDHAAVDVEFLGVWDTVGALGVPDQLGILNLFDVHERHRFADTRLGPHIRHARHALALDEARGPFTPTLWANADEVDGTEGRTVKQVWFAGDHCGVGGGYVERELSDLALGWMIDEARASGLTFSEAIAAQVRSDGHDDVLHDSCTGFYQMMGPVPRAVPLLDAANPRPHIHPSVLTRQACPPITAAPYRPSHVVAVGESVTRPVFAREPWNATGLYLEAGEYEFTAAGEWLDGAMSVGPDGADDGKFHRGEVLHLVGAAMSRLQSAFRSLTDNEAAAFFGTPRCPDVPWMTLVGVVAAQELDDDGAQQPYEPLGIGSGGKFAVARPGYLYAFANDAWTFYDNNRGSVELTVSRLS